MKYLRLIVLPCFMLSSCGSLEPEEDAPPVTEKKIEKIQEPPPPEPVVVKKNDDLDFADPNTTGELLNKDDIKTIVGADAAKNAPPVVEEDNFINVDPPKVPEIKSPDEG